MVFFFLVLLGTWCSQLRLKILLLACKQTAFSCGLRFPIQPESLLPCLYLGFMHITCKTHQLHHPGYCLCTCTFTYALSPYSSSIHGCDDNKNSHSQLIATGNVEMPAASCDLYNYHYSHRHDGLQTSPLLCQKICT